MKKKTKTRNKFEARTELQLMRAGIKYKYENRKIPYVLAKHYIPDWEIEVPNGFFLLENKGYFRPEHKAKMIAVKRQHPHLDIRILFYSYNAKYCKWAQKHGFKYAWGTIPEEWLNGTA